MKPVRNSERAWVARLGAIAAALLLSACVVEARPSGEREETTTAGLTTPGDPSDLGNGTAGSTGTPPDPAAPRTQAGPPHEPDPSPWKDGNVGDPHEPDPSPWRHLAEAEIH